MSLYIKGRGAQINLVNKFSRFNYHPEISDFNVENRPGADHISLLKKLLWVPKSCRP